jgi:Rod binding domain-containing protein
VSDISGLASVTGAGMTLPADVRKAGKEGEDTYRAALGFERTLLEQLTKTMSKDMAGGDSDSTDSSDESGDGGSGASAATSAYNDMLPGTLADAVTNAGGLGLAHDLWLKMRSAS